MKAQAVMAEFATGTHAGFRSPASTAMVMGVAAGMLAACLQTELVAALRLPAGVATVVLGGFMVVVVAAVCAHARLGFASRMYQVLNGVESAWGVLGSLVLIYASGPLGTFFWSVFIGICVQTGSFGHNRWFNGALFVGGPLALAVALIVFRDDWVAAQITGLAALVSLAAWATTLKSTARLAEVLAAKRLLEIQEADRALLRDRERIARDLHDGLGAVLTGLLYRVREQVSREQRAGSESATSDQEAASGLDEEGVEGRIRECIDELRGVVWVLREDDRSFGELCAWLQTRCADLCSGEIELTFHAPDCDRQLDTTLRMHLVRMVLEAVRNAVRHGAPRHIEVSLQVADEIKIVVKDDGSGFSAQNLHPHSGGLANLRTRSSALGGTLSIASSLQGTELSFHCRPTRLA
jgi:signal transduction histidine kinase